MTIRRTNNGVPIDFDALIAASRNNSPAVGNMPVNAKGDVLGKNGSVVQPNADRVRAYYRDNPKSSTKNTSLKSTMQPAALVGDEDPAPDLVPTPEETAPPKKSTKKPKPVSEDPDEFAVDAEPLGYKEIELPNGDIQLVPYYKEDQE